MSRGDGPVLEVVDPGALTTVQDLGRPGYGRVAVGRSGAFDRDALALANRLVGNPEGAAGLEAVLAGPVLRALRPVLVAVAGAPGPLTVAGRPADRGSPLGVGTGEVLVVGPASAGVRAYVAVRGGLAVPHVLGSAATDTLSGLGPAPLAAGDLLVAGPAGAGAVHVDHVAVSPPADPTVLRVIPGPDDDRVGAAGLATLLGST
jgi:allophanate hydrolase subunit 2